MWVFLWNFNPFKTSAQDLMADVDAQERRTLFETIDQLSKSRALTKNGEALLEQNIDALCTAMQWKKERFQIYPRLPVDGMIPIDIRMKFVGKLDRIPVFIEGLKYMPFLGVLQQLDIDIKNQSFSLQLRFFKTQPKVPSWIDEYEELSPKDRAILRQGFLLMYWKSVQQFFAQEQQKNALNNPHLQLEIARNITLKKSMHWEKGQNFYK